MFALRARSFMRALPDHPLLDRVVRGRAWIPLLGVLLAGIVAMQVEELKLGASIGRSLERSSALESRNQQLRASVAELGDGQRIERIASGMGMVMPPPGAQGFLSANQAGSVQRALANIHVPDPSAFMLLQSTNGAVVTGPGQVAPTSSIAGTLATTTGASATTTGASATTTSGSTTTTGGSATTTSGSTTTTGGSATTTGATGGSVSAPGG